MLGNFGFFLFCISLAILFSYMFIICFCVYGVLFLIFFFFVGKRKRQVLSFSLFPSVFFLLISCLFFIFFACGFFFSFYDLIWRETSMGTG